jgi:alpha-tubulin suppressor-like RCC1 family protein
MPRSISRLLIQVLLFASLAGCRDGVGPGRRPEPEPEDPVRPLSVRVVSLVKAYQTTCALAADGKLHCWGENRFGEFGNGTLSPADRPVLGGGGRDFVSVHGSKGTPQICGIARGGAGYCWGYNANGELGSGTVADAYSPVPIAGNVRFRTIASSYHSCGLDLTGRAYCWGSGLGGQLGTGNDNNALVPTPVAGDASYTTITNGMQFSCALRQDGRADCWGWSGGRGGGGGGASVNRPTPVSGALRFRDISAGEDHVCAAVLDGAAYCWGKVSPDAVGTPTRIPGSHRFVKVASGSRAFPYGPSCGLTSEGDAYCWHDGLEPVPVPGSRRFAGLVGGVNGFCGYTPGGAAFCWRWLFQRVDGQAAQWVLSQPEPIPDLSATG